VHRNRVRKHGLFPLWHYASRKQVGRNLESVDASLLCALYDYKRRVSSDAGEPGTTHEYQRRRILWRMWHYEKADGDVTVDAFPFITYDRRQDGFSKTSFLWRFFRYEKSAESKKLDLLFLPLIRKEP